VQSDAADAEDPNTYTMCVCKAGGFMSKQSSPVLWPLHHRCLEDIRRVSGVPVPIWFHLKATRFALTAKTPPCFLPRSDNWGGGGS